MSRAGPIASSRIASSSVLGRVLQGEPANATLGPKPRTSDNLAGWNGYLLSLLALRIGDGVQSCPE